MINGLIGGIITLFEAKMRHPLNRGLAFAHKLVQLLQKCLFAFNTDVLQFRDIRLVCNISIIIIGVIIRIVINFIIIVCIIFHNTIPSLYWLLSIISLIEGWPPSGPDLRGLTLIWGIRFWRRTSLTIADRDITSDTRCLLSRPTFKFGR